MIHMRDNQKPIKKYNEKNYMVSMAKSKYASDLVHLMPQHVHHYEVLPYIYNSIITMNGDVLEKQSFHNEGRKYKVIYNGNTTIVILEDGTKGIAKRNPKDLYDKNKGKHIAHTRALIAQLQKELKELTQ